ncbi:hypothetical protein Bca101_063160 [Brassica carinata]
METTNRNWREENDNGKEDEKASSRKPLFFPPEIITEIGIRLPSKSIGRLRCVSKTFCSLLSDQKFTRKHLHRNLKNESGQRRLLLSSNNLFTVDVDIKPLCSTKNDGEVLLRIDGKLVLYNFESNTSRAVWRSPVLS